MDHSAIYSLYTIKIIIIILIIIILRCRFKYHVKLTYQRSLETTSASTDISR